MLDLAASYLARLQHRTVICTIASINVTTANIVFWLQHTCPYLSSRKVQISQLPPPLKMTPIFILVFSLIRSNSLFVFTLLFFASLLISSLWCGQWWGIFWLCCCCLFSAIVYSLGSNVSDQDPVGVAWAMGAASSVCARMIDTSQTFPLALIGCIGPGAVDFYTAELFLNLQLPSSTQSTLLYSFD